MECPNKSHNLPLLLFALKIAPSFVCDFTNCSIFVFLLDVLWAARFTTLRTYALLNSWQPLHNIPFNHLSPRALEISTFKQPSVSHLAPSSRDGPWFDPSILLRPTCLCSDSKGKKIEKFGIFRQNFQNPNPNHKWLTRPRSKIVVPDPSLPLTPLLKNIFFKLFYHFRLIQNHSSWWIFLTLSLIITRCLPLSEKNLIFLINCVENTQGQKLIVHEF